MSDTNDCTTVDRFWSKVDRSGGSDVCWIWQGSKVGGYGAFGKKRNRKYAHRFSYELIHGEIPAKMCVCHRCDNPSCVNPAHLFLGTHVENMHDKGRKGRGKGAIGITNGAHKLNEVSVLDIRRRYSTGSVTMATLAREYGVSNTAVRDVVKRKRWGHVADND